MLKTQRASAHWPGWLSTLYLTAGCVYCYCTLWEDATLLAEGIPDMPGGSSGANSFLPSCLPHLIFLAGPGWIVQPGSQQVQAQGSRLLLWLYSCIQRTHLDSLDMLWLMIHLAEGVIKPLVELPNYKILKRRNVDSIFLFQYRLSSRLFVKRNLEMCQALVYPNPPGVSLYLSHLMRIHFHMLKVIYWKKSIILSFFHLFCHWIMTCLKTSFETFIFLIQIQSYTL